MQIFSINFPPKLIIDLKRTPWYLIPLCIGFFFRIFGFTSAALWYDEAFSLFCTRPNLFEMIRNLQINLSPPGWEILLWFITRIFGWNEFSSRILSVVSGCSILVLVYLIAKIFHLNQGQTITALTGSALMPYMIWMSQEGKVYALFSCLYLLGIIWAFKGKWLGLFGVMGIMLWCHYIAFLYIPALIIIALMIHIQSWKKILTAAFMAFIVWTPWIFTFANRFKNFESISGSKVKWYGTFINGFAGSMIESFFGWTLPKDWCMIFIVFLEVLTIVWIISLPIINILSKKMLKKNQRISFNILLSKIMPTSFSVISGQLLLLVPILIPFTLFLGVSVLFHINIFFYRTASIMVLPIIIWTSCVLSDDFANRAVSLANGILRFTWTIILIFSVSLWRPEAKGGNIREAASFINQEWRNGDVLFYSAGTAGLSLWQFLPNKPQYLINGKDIFENDLDITETNIRQVPFSSIAKHNSWVVWDTSELNEGLDENSYLLIQNIVKHCKYKFNISFPHLLPWKVYYCENTAISKISNLGLQFIR